MGRSRSIAAVSLTAILLLGGCGGDDSPSSSDTTAATVAATTTTTPPSAALKAALLQASDVPGSKASPATQGDAELSACFPGNPLGAKDDPSEVDSPDLDLVQGAVTRKYSSSARMATPEQARAFVETFVSAAGSACVLKTFKEDFASPPNPIDASGMTGKAAKIGVGDGGALMPITGNIKAGGKSTALSVDLLVFSKGPVVVFMTVGAFGGKVVRGQTVELGQKIAGRLP